jgi:hypothetical protein
MSLSREEIQVRLGIDSSQMQSQGAHAESYIEHLGQKMVTKLNRLIGVSIFHMALHLVQELLPTAEEFWDRIYGVEKGEDTKLDRLREKFHRLRESIEKATIAYEKSVFESAYKHESDTGKKKMLDREIEKNTAEQMKQSEKAKEARESASYWKKKGRDEDDFKRMQNKIAEAATADSEKLRLQIEYVKLTDQLTDLEEDIAKKKERQAEAARREAESNAKSAKSTYDKWQHATKSLAEAMAGDKPGVGDVDPSGAGHYEHIRGRSGLGSNRFIPNRLSAEDIRARDRADKIAELKDAAERTALVLEGFDEKGISFRAAQ